MAGESLFEDMLRSAQRSAVHLEMRDGYLPDDPDFAAWRAGSLKPNEQWRWWIDLIHTTVVRGVQVRRARIVSEPVTDYIRFEYDVTADLNIAAGEEVRWLPRRRASDLALPGNDFWLFDNATVIFNHFAGDGSSPSDPFEVTVDPGAVKLCTTAFEAVWERAVPHKDYQPS
jgi:hypothetical protein